MLSFLLVLDVCSMKSVRERRMSTAFGMRLVVGGEWQRAAIYSFEIEPTQSRSFPF